MTFVALILGLIAALLSLPVALLFVEIVAAFRTRAEPEFANEEARSGRTVVVVPAHNESLGIVPTLGDIRLQLTGQDRLVVVADNCTDDTASIAAAHGAEVIVRDDPSRKGKGFALGFAIECLSSDTPDFVVFVDADCRLPADMIAKLSGVCSRTTRPLQACYRMNQAKNSPIDHGFAQFAWTIKNYVRPLGLRNMNCPVHLMGTGMIFPWHVIRSVPLSSGNLVEDMKLGLDLAEAGHAARFFPSVEVTSEFPVSERGTERQRQRWVQGHLKMMRSVPRLVLEALADRNQDLLVLALDLLIPPLSLLVLLVSSASAVSLLAALAGLSTVPLVIAAANLVLLGSTISLAWFGFSRDILPFRKLLMIAPLLLAKLRLFVRIFRGRGPRDWIRTERGEVDRMNAPYSE